MKDLKKVELIKLVNYHQQKQKEAEDENEPYRHQNRLYRESINLALNHIHTGNFTLATVELNKALSKEV